MSTRNITSDDLKNAPFVEDAINSFFTADKTLTYKKLVLI